MNTLLYRRKPIFLYMKNELYITKDQYIATTLYAFGMKLDTTERENGVCYFLFENLEKCEEIVKKYYSQKLKICPKTLFNAFRDIKSILYK